MVSMINRTKYGHYIMLIIFVSSYNEGLSISPFKCIYFLRPLNHQTNYLSTLGHKAEIPHPSVGRSVGWSVDYASFDARVGLLVGMWKRSIFIPLPQLPLPLPLPFYSSNTGSYPILQIGSGQSLLHPYLLVPFFSSWDFILSRFSSGI